MKGLGWGHLRRAQGERLSQRSPDKHEQPSCHEPVRKRPPVDMGYLFFTTAVKKEVSAAKIFSWGLAEGPAPCSWLSYAFLLEEAKLSFCHETRQSGIGVHAPHLCQISGFKSQLHHSLVALGK